MLRGQFSERCAPSPRNPARDQIGTPRAITSESADKTKESYLGFVALASVKLWIPVVHET
jgi:hypothetical protein